MAKVPTKDKPGKPVGKPEPAPEAEKEKTPRKEKADFDVPEGGFDTWPADYKSGDHKPLKRKNFKDESVWLFHRADELEKRAKNYRIEGENFKKLGNVKERAKAKKLIKMQMQMQELRKQLEADGVDVDALLPKQEKIDEASEAQVTQS